MATGNHLTVRDYFDHALVGKSLRRTAFSSHPKARTGKRSFSQILALQENRSANQINRKSRGLTIVDYLKNPVRGRYKSHSLPYKSNDAISADKTAASGTLNAKDRSAESNVRTHAKRKSKQLTSPAELAALPEQTESKERLLIEKSIHKAARKYRLPPSLIKGVIRAESNFQADAVSRAGAQGLMQLMPGTARELGVDDPFDIEQNIDGGASYLRKMLDSFGGDIKVALAAYNAGPGAVEKYGGNIPPFRETEQYVKRVLSFTKKMA